MPVDERENLDLTSRDALNEGMLQRTERFTNTSHSFDEIEAMANASDFGESDAKSILDALDDMLEGYHNDLEEGYSVDRGSIYQDHADVALIETVITKMEEMGIQKRLVQRYLEE